MGGSRYKAGVLPVLLIGVERPGLAGLLAARGMVARTTGTSCVAALVADGHDRPICPAIVEVRSLAEVGRLLDDGAADAVLSTDPDSLVAARLAALVRRTHSATLQVGDIVIETLDRRVTSGGRPLALLPREYSLLLYLARHVGVVVDHAKLHHAIWERGFDPGTNVIAVHVSRLRAKLGKGRVTVITERGRGYRLVVAGDGTTG